MSRFTALILSCLIAALAVAGCGGDDGDDGDTGASTAGTFVGTGTNRAILTVPVQVKTVGSWKDNDVAANVFERDAGVTAVSLVVSGPDKDLDTIELALLEGDCEEAAAPDDDADPFRAAEAVIEFEGPLEDYTDGKSVVFVREKKGNKVVGCGVIPKVDTGPVVSTPPSTTAVTVPEKHKPRDS